MIVMMMFIITKINKKTILINNIIIIKNKRFVNLLLRSLPINNNHTNLLILIHNEIHQCSLKSLNNNKQLTDFHYNINLGIHYLLNSLRKDYHY